MAINQKGLRRIVVDDVAYLWRVRHRATYNQACFEDVPTTAVVILDAKCVQKLEITFNFVRFENIIAPKKMYPAQSITPKIITDCIRQAIDQGWQAEGTGVFKYVHKPFLGNETFNK